MQKILLDIDGVVADFVGHLCSYLYMHGHHYEADDFTTWDLKETLTPNAHQLMVYYLNKEGFCQTMPPYQGAGDFIEALKEKGKVVALTAATESSKYWFSERLHWNKAFGIEKTIFCPSTEKKDHDGDVLIEDNLQTAKQWAEFRSLDEGRAWKPKAILLNRPWNSGPTPFGVYRVHSYQEALELIGT